MMRLSIIVPIYNVEQYIARCIESLLAQDIDNYEIILVIDGATDNSRKISESYAEKYEKIKIVIQENKGLSGARNTGLKEANGEYVLFVDSDDWVDQNKLKPLLEKAEKCDLDVGVGDFRYIDDIGIISINEELPAHFESPVDGVIFFRECLKTKKITMMVWKSIYKRKFLLDNRLFFREGFNHEDEEWTPRVYLKAKRVMDIPVAFYNYFIHTQCISKNPSNFKKNSLDMIKNCYALKSLSQSIDDLELRNLFQDRIQVSYLSAFYKGALWEKEFGEYVNKDFFSNMYSCKKTKHKIRLFCCNKRLYFYLNKLQKKLR